jgi:glyoxalase-like protein
MKSPVLLLTALAGGVVAQAASPSPSPKAMQTDHLILGIRDLDEGIRLFEERTGVRPMIGGDHPGRGTRNALVSLGPGLYIEILAPQAGGRDSVTAGGLRTLADLTPMGWAVSIRDVEAARQRLGAAGFGLTGIMPGARARPDGSRLEWQTFGIEKPKVAGVPFFIRWGDRTTHPSQDAPAGCRLEALRVLTPDDDDLRRALAALPLEVPVEKALRPGMEVRLRCPRGTVRFSGGALSLL